MEFIASWTNKISQMSFHDVRYQLSVTEGLDLVRFFAPFGDTPHGAANLN